MKTYTIFPFRCRVNQDGLTNVIENIMWRVTQPTDFDGTTYDLTVQGITTLPAPNPNTFIETESLTKAQVIEWIETYDDVDSKFNSAIELKRSQLNPTHTNITPNFN
jgi:hypothetical protein